MDNGDVRAVEGALRDGAGTAEEIADLTGRPLGVAQAALDRLVRDRLALRRGADDAGRPRYLALASGRRF